MPASDVESDGSYETDTDDESEEESGGQMLKPVYIPKESRLTIKEQEAKLLQEELREQEKRFEAEERKNQTRQLVADSILKMNEADKEAAVDNDSDNGLPDDTDDVDDELEYGAWKVREITRLKRDAEEREVSIIEKAEIVRRRGMTDAQRLEEDTKLGLISDEAPEKPKWNFMQKYFHKGVFYMDEDSIKDKDDVRLKNYAKEATLEDHVDKEKLPEVLQVKNFGKRGRTKYTHLLDQDTTFNMKSQKRTDVKLDQKVMNRYLDKRSGVGKL
jgi:microfibrillar-associated protein 1